MMKGWSVNELLETAIQSEQLVPFVFSLPTELSRRKTILEDGVHSIRNSIVSEVLDIPLQDEQPIAIEKMVEEVIGTSQKVGHRFKTRFNQVAESVVSTGRLMTTIASAVKILGAVCPHCAVAVVQSASAVSKSIGLSPVNLGGHFHDNGTFHETESETQNDYGWFDNPFKWLEVDNTSTELKHAA